MLPIPCTVCWIPSWSASHPDVGIEHLRLSEGLADGLVVAIDDELGPFRLHYRLSWDAQWCLRDAALSLIGEEGVAARTMRLATDGQGHWTDDRGAALPALEGCLDIDIWPTPFTNSFPIRRVSLAVGERRFLGLYPRSVAKAALDEIPIVRRKIRAVLDRTADPQQSYEAQVLVDMRAGQAGVDGDALGERGGQRGLAGALGADDGDHQRLAHALSSRRQARQPTTDSTANSAYRITVSHRPLTANSPTLTTLTANQTSQFSISLRPSRNWPSRLPTVGSASR